MKRVGSLEVPWRALLKLACIVAAGIWALSPLLPGDWGGDDDLYFVHNPLLHDPQHLWKTWFAPGSFIEYYPITETLQMVQWALWHHDAYGYVFTNIVLHLGNALLVWLLLQRLGLRQGWLGGLLFALHPLNVETVGWISEFKNTLSLSPFLLSMIAWMRFSETGRRGDYLSALALFVAAMLCKISMAPFPVVILIYAWWKRGRIDRRDLWASLPFFVVSLALGSLTILCGQWFAGHYAHARYSAPLLPGLAAHLAQAGLIAAFYFAKFFAPWTPAPYYPKWEVHPYAVASYLPWLILLVAIGVCWRKRKSWGPTVLLGLGYFFLMLAPFLGVPETSVLHFSWAMDHFLYLPMIGLIGLVVAGIEGMASQLPTVSRRAGAILLLLVFVALGWETHAYARISSDQETLMRYELRINPNSAASRGILADALRDKGDLAGAMTEFQRALALDPRNANLHEDFGVTLIAANRLPEAREQFQQAILLVLDYADAYDNLGAVDQQMGQPEAAIAALHRALQIADFAQAHNDLGNVFLQTNRAEEAVAEFQKAVRLNPDVAQLHENLGVALCTAKRPAEGVAELHIALTLDPRDSTARTLLQKLAPASIPPASP
jgi:Tfp pilus assembly protein PilF